jgi:hypothetical protein
MTLPVFYVSLFMEIIIAAASIVSLVGTGELLPTTKSMSTATVEKWGQLGLHLMILSLTRQYIRLLLLWKTSSW